MKMRKPIFALFVVLLFSVSTILTISMTPVYADLDKDLVAYWNFDEPSGNITKDDVGDHILKLTGKEKLTDKDDGDYEHVSGKTDNCLDFNNYEGLSWALSDSSSSDPLRIAKNLTIQMWFKTEHELLRAGLIDYHSISSRADRLYLVYLIYNERKIRYVHQSIEGTTEFVTSDSNAWSPNVWQRLTVVRDATKKTIDIYVNGVCVGSDTYDHNPVKTGGAYLHIGTQVEFVGGIQNPVRFYAFDGCIDEAKIWNRALSAREIAASMSSMVMEHKFENIKDDKCFDTSAFSNHGTISGATSYYPGYGGSNTCIEFDGIDDYIEVDNHDSLNPIDQISVAANINCSDYTVGHNSAIVRKNGVFALALTTTGKVRFTVWINGKPTSATSSISIEEGVWTPIKGTYDGSNVRVFIENVERGVTPVREPTQETYKINETKANLYIGAGNNNNWLSYDGKLDTIRISNEAN
jgi:hypothetical protein